ncbi:MAG: branched-chain amino acid transaminase [Pseudomonadota bacterium]
MPITPTPKIWMNGALVPWDEAVVHVGTHTLHYGTGIYEGVRAYPTDRGPGLFRLTDHIARMYRSARILAMPLTHGPAEIVEACKAVVREAKLGSCYVRPLAYYGYGELGLDTGPCPVEMIVMAWPWASVRGAETNARGVRLMVSSWRRHDHNIMPPMAKTVGNYVNSSLAKAEARAAGYDDCVMLNPAGMVAECTAENIFVVRGGMIHTPPLSAGGLEGITQDTVRRLAQDLGFELRVSELSRSDLYVADEIFVCGTASEVSCVASIDGRAVACPGPVGAALRETFSDVVHGRDPAYAGWVETAHLEGVA